MLGEASTRGRVIMEDSSCVKEHVTCCPQCVPPTPLPSSSASLTFFEPRGLFALVMWFSPDLKCSLRICPMCQPFPTKPIRCLRQAELPPSSDPCSSSGPCHSIGTG